MDSTFVPSAPFGAYTMPALSMGALPANSKLQASLLPSKAASTRSGGEWAAWTSLAVATITVANSMRKDRGITRRSRRHADQDKTPINNAAITPVTTGQTNPSDSDFSRAAVLRRLGTGTAALLATPLPAKAESLEEARKKLGDVGLPKLIPDDDPSWNLPFGWSVAVTTIGTTRYDAAAKVQLGNEPLSVTFQVPPLWVVNKPIVTVNGVSGALSTNNYGTGDAATFWVNTKPKVKLADMKQKDFIKNIKKALSIKVKSGVDEFTITNIRDGEPGYRFVEYTYNFYSGAGFTMQRQGIASFCQVGNEGNIQCLWAATVPARWEENQLGQVLTRVIETFRVGKIPDSIGKGLIQNIDSDLIVLGEGLD